MSGNNVQAGKYLYNKMDLPLIGKILNALTKHDNGVTFSKLAMTPEIMKDFQNDFDRSQTKVKASLSGLRFRSVVSEIKGLDHSVTYRILDKNSANELIKASDEYVNLIQQKSSDVAESVVEVEVSKPVSKTANILKDKKKMSTKVVKLSRLFMNMETNKVQEFGLGRPSKEKLACECDKEGKLLNPLAFAEVAKGFVKTVKDNSIDKMLKPDLIVKVKALMQELETVKAERDQWAAIAQSFESDGEADDETDENESDLSLNAEAVEETDDEFEDLEDEDEDDSCDEDDEDLEDEDDSENESVNA